MKRLHYCKDILLQEYLENRIQKNIIKTKEDLARRVYDVSKKPHGLWYSINDEWKQWCIDNNWRTDHLEKCYELEIDKDLILSVSMDELNDVVSAYTAKGILGYQPNWEEISEYYSGFEILDFNHLKTCTEKELAWAYGWDVSSGCIWDVDAIKSVEVVYE